TFIEQQKKKASVSLDAVESSISNKIKADKHFDPNKLEWKLQVAIQQLPEKQRVVFNLRYYDEMPYEEMSRILETSEGALKASYHHAVRSEEHTSELQSRRDLVCRLLLEKKKNKKNIHMKTNTTARTIKH